MRKIAIGILSVVFLFSCTSKTTNKEKTDEGTQKVEQNETVEIVSVSPDDFEAKASELMGKIVKMEGTVLHVCAHTGKKLFLAGTNEDEAVRVDVDEKIGTFDVALEGSTVVVEGYVNEKRVDNKYIDELEAKINESTEEAENHKCETEEKLEGSKEHKDHKAGEHNGDGHGHGEQDGKGEGEHAGGAFAHVKSLRTQLQESGKEYLSFYSFICTKVEEKK